MMRESVNRMTRRPRTPCQRRQRNVSDGRLLMNAPRAGNMKRHSRPAQKHNAGRPTQRSAEKPKVDGLGAPAGQTPRNIPKEGTEEGRILGEPRS